jgi:hypothetical protein
LTVITVLAFCHWPTEFFSYQRSKFGAFAFANRPLNGPSKVNSETIMNFALRNATLT